MQETEAGNAICDWGNGSFCLKCIEAGSAISYWGNGPFCLTCIEAGGAISYWGNGSLKFNFEQLFLEDLVLV